MRCANGSAQRPWASHASAAWPTLAAAVAARCPDGTPATRGAAAVATTASNATLTTWMRSVYCDDDADVDGPPAAWGDEVAAWRPPVTGGRCGGFGIASAEAPSGGAGENGDADASG